MEIIWIHREQVRVLIMFLIHKKNRKGSIIHIQEVNLMTKDEIREFLVIRVEAGVN